MHRGWVSLMGLLTPPCPPRPPHALPRAAPPAPLTVQPSSAVWYSAASVASRSSSWYRGQLRVGNLSSWEKLRLREDRVTGTPGSQCGELGLWSPRPNLSLQNMWSLPNLAAQHGDGGSPKPDSSDAGPVSRLPARTASPSHGLPPPRGLGLSPSLPPPAPLQPPDLVLGDGHRVHRDGPPGSLWAPRGGLGEQPCEVGLSTLQRAVKVSASNIHLPGRGDQCRLRGPRQQRTKSFRFSPGSKVRCWESEPRVRWSVWSSALEGGIEGQRSRSLSSGDGGQNLGEHVGLKGSVASLERKIRTA